MAGLEELETLEVRQYERLVQGVGSVRAHFRLIPCCRSKVSHSSTLGHSRSIRRLSHRSIALRSKPQQDRQLERAEALAFLELCTLLDRGRLFPVNQRYRQRIARGI